MVSDFVLVGSAVVALAPKSHGRFVMMWIVKYLETDDEWGTDWADTLGRYLYYMILVVGCTLLEKFIS